MRKIKRAVCCFCGGREEIPASEARNSREAAAEYGLVECFAGLRHHPVCPPKGDRDIERDRQGAIIFA
jgi:hypothetical protein